MSGDLTGLCLYISFHENVHTKLISTLYCTKSVNNVYPQKSHALGNYTSLVQVPKISKNKMNI